MYRLITYTRRSREEQEDSQKTQEQLAIDYCERNGHLLVNIYHEEPISRSTGVERRPILSKIYGLVKKKDRGFDGILVWKFDRLFGNDIEEALWWAHLDKYKCLCLSTCEHMDRNTAGGRFIARIMAAQRQFEVENTGERIRDHNLAMALREEWPGGQPPLGLIYDPTTKEITVSDRVEDAILVFEEFIRNAGNASRTARALNQSGIVNRLGNIWRDDSVLDIIKSPIYRQKIRYDDREIEAVNLIPRIIPVDLISAVDALTGRFKQYDRSRPRKYAYSSMLKCSECGTRLKVHVYDKKKRFAWVCRAKKETGLCKSSYVANRYVDKMVGMALGQIIKSQKMKEDIINTPSENKIVNQKSGKIKHIRSMIENTKELFIRGKISIEEYDRRVNQYEADIKDIELTNEPVRIIPPVVLELMDNIETRWFGSDNDNFQEDTKKQVLGLIRAEAVVNTGERPLWLIFSSDLTEEPIEVHLKYKNR